MRALAPIMTPPSGATALLFHAASHVHLTPYLAALHAACITHDGAIAGFLPPLSHDKLLAWWKQRIAEAAAGSRRIWILVANGLDTVPTAVSTTSPWPPGPRLVGVVMLVLPPAETTPFRAHVEMLLIHRSFRRRGGATALIAALEADARILGRSVLLLDTEADSPAEAACKKLGYVELGRIPQYALNPAGDLRQGAFLYKHL